MKAIVLVSLPPTLTVIYDGVTVCTAAEYPDSVLFFKQHTAPRTRENPDKWYVAELFPGQFISPYLILSPPP